MATKLKSDQLVEEIEVYGRISESNITTTDIVKSEIGYSPAISPQNCHFIKIKEIGYCKDSPARESLENVISSLNNPEFNFVYLLSGSDDGVELYLGVTKDYHIESEGRLHAYDMGEMLRETFNGNFLGSDIEDVTTDDELQQNIINKLSKVRRGSLITGIPSINEKSEEKEINTQSLECLVNSMSGAAGEWHLMIICDAMSKDEILDLKGKLFSIFDKVYAESKLTVQESQGENSSETFNETNGTSKSSNKGTSKSSTTGTNKGQSSGSSSSTSSGSSKSATTGVSDGVTTGTSNSKSSGASKGKSSGLAHTREQVSKECQMLLQYMDEELFDRVNQGMAKGFFKTSVFALAENYLTHERLVRGITSIWQGDKSNLSPLKSMELPMQDGFTHKVLNHFQSLQIETSGCNELALILGHPSNDYKLDMRSCLTASELSLICSLPTTELTGLPLRKSIYFGLNPKEPANDSECINLGSIMHQGRALLNRPLFINKEMLSRHVFVAGVTGSGKTTTCKRLLSESELPFLIIEPAKTEYRSLLSEIDDLQVYTLGNENLAPFRFNPFELMQGESITSHVDLLKAAFTAAFPMEAAMPYLLEEAIYECYSQYGWNTDGWMTIEDANSNVANPWDSDGACWPTMDDLLKNMDKVVKSKNFDSRLESDYTASLVARFKNLTVGSKGQMLNCKLSTDIVELLDKKVILELDDLKSPEDKCLLMGLIIARLSEAIKMRFKKDESFKHITLIEEAHRLLERPSPGDDGSRKHAVGMFTDLLAEVRKYGESLVIVDQIPNKLAPEVLKNTNTKIIHKLFAKDDRVAIGDTVGLNDDQKDFLSSLRVGEVVIYSGEWSKAVHAQVKCVDSDDKKLSELEQEELVRVSGVAKLCQDQKRYFPELAEKDLLDEATLLRYQQVKRNFWTLFKRILSKSKKTPENTYSLKTLVDIKKEFKALGEMLYETKEFHKFITQDFVIKSNPTESEKEEFFEVTVMFFKCCMANNVEEGLNINDELFIDVLNRIFC